MQSHGIFRLIILGFSVKSESVACECIEQNKSFVVDIMGIHKEVERKKKV